MALKVVNIKTLVKQLSKLLLFFVLVHWIGVSQDFTWLNQAYPDGKQLGRRNNATGGTFKHAVVY